MKNIKAKTMLSKCLSKIKKMSQEEFNEIIKEKGINEIDYNVNNYVGGGFTLNLMLDLKEFDTKFNQFNYEINSNSKDDSIIINCEKNIYDDLFLAA